MVFDNIRRAFAQMRNGMGNTMKDRFGRDIDYLRASITDRCNLRCHYCMPGGISFAPVEEILTFEEIETICKAAAGAGIGKIKITGGEPLMRPGCASLIGIIKKIPGIRQVTMTTNGVLFGQNLTALLENGLDAVNFSLDTLKRETYEKITGKDALCVVVTNIEKAVKAGLRVKINATLHHGVNDGEWRALSELTRQLPVDVRFIEMMPIGAGKDFKPVFQEELMSQFQAAYPGFLRDESAHGNGPAKYYQIPGAIGSVGFISALHGKFCHSCNRLRLTSKGKLKPCLCFGDEVDLMKIVRGEGSDKNRQLKEAFLQAVWNKPKEHRFERADEITEKKQMAQIGG